MIFNRQPYIPLGFVIVFSLLMLKLPGRTSAQLKLAVSGLFLPLFGLSASAEHLAAQASQAVVPRAQLNRQLEELRRENNQLRLQLTQANAALAENARLHQALQFSSRIPWKHKLARVIGRDPANWWRTIRIDLGLRDGVPANAPVLTAEGLVGRVAQVGYRHSQVVLLGDPDCRVSALIEDTRDHGVIAPDSASPLDNILVDLSYLSRNSPLKAGQRVVTSGLGGIFPKGILIGQIVDFHSVEFGLFVEARVRVAAKLNALEELWVITD
jgi:rod shape-determining protein MreC